jgi:hypothetical protein
LGCEIASENGKKLDKGERKEVNKVYKFVRAQKIHRKNNTEKRKNYFFGDEKKLGKI